jgi:hypothetical protein
MTESEQTAGTMLPTDLSTFCAHQALLVEVGEFAIKKIVADITAGRTPDSSLLTTMTLEHTLALAYFEPEYIPAFAEAVICHRRDDPERCGFREWARGFVERHPVTATVATGTE